MTDREKSSYRQLLKSSVLVGGSSVVTLTLGIARTKFIALLAGTTGVGLIGALGSVTTLVSSIAGMGINSSGVRQIAEAAGSGDPARVAQTAVVLRRTSVLLGAAGMLLLLLLCLPISHVTFESAAYAPALAVLSVTVLFSEVSAGQSALLQGLRRIRDLASANIAGAFFGTLAAVPLVYILRGDGVVPSIVAVSLAAFLSTWWFARRVEIEPVVVTPTIMKTEASRLLRLGAVLMSAGVMTSVAAYLIRVVIVREMGLEAAGLYQAAWNLSGVYVTFILGAMGADYYPRLAAAAQDDGEVNRLVNEQAEAALLMALPGILATIVFAPWVIQIFYSDQFSSAVEVLRWQILGVLGRVVSWPVGFVLLAKERAKTFFWAELASSTAYMVLVWLGIRVFGLPGIGMAFFLLYLGFSVLVAVLVGGITGFRWSRQNLKIGAVAIVATAIVFVVCMTVSGVWGTVVGSFVTVTCGVFSLRTLCKRMGIQDLRGAMAAVAGRVGAASGRAK